MIKYFIIRCLPVLLAISAIPNAIAQSTTSANLIYMTDTITGTINSCVLSSYTVSNHSAAPLGTTYNCTPALSQTEKNPLQKPRALAVGNNGFVYVNDLSTGLWAFKQNVGMLIQPTLVTPANIISADVGFIKSFGNYLVLTNTKQNIVSIYTQNTNGSLTLFTTINTKAPTVSVAYDEQNKILDFATNNGQIFGVNTQTKAIIYNTGYKSGQVTDMAITGNQLYASVEGNYLIDIPINSGGALNINALTNFGVGSIAGIAIVNNFGHNAPPYVYMASNRRNSNALWYATLAPKHSTLQFSATGMNINPVHKTSTYDIAIANPNISINLQNLHNSGKTLPLFMYMSNGKNIADCPVNPTDHSVIVADCKQSILTFKMKSVAGIVIDTEAPGSLSTMGLVADDQDNEIIASDQISPTNGQWFNEKIAIKNLMVNYQLFSPKYLALGKTLNNQQSLFVANGTSPTLLVYTLSKVVAKGSTTTYFNTTPTIISAQFPVGAMFVDNVNKELDINSSDTSTTDVVYKCPLSILTPNNYLSSNNCTEKTLTGQASTANIIANSNDGIYMATPSGDIYYSDTTSSNSQKIYSLASNITGLAVYNPSTAIANNK